MTLNGHFTLNDHYYEHHLFNKIILYIVTVESAYTRDQRWCANRGSGPWSAEYLGSAENCGSFVDATSSEP